MGFSSALQGRVAHEALLLRLDAELRLMDAMKRCINQKAKCDKDYAIALAQVAQQGLKVDRADDLHGSLITKAWRTLMEELEQTAKNLKCNAEFLEMLSQDKLTQLYQDKRKARKTYQEEHSRIATKFNHLTEEVAKKKTEYQKHLEYYKGLRSRFEEHYIKAGRSGRKLDDVRDKYQKACRKLHLAHNEYVLLITEAVEVEQDFRTVLLPGLLEHQQSLQEGFIQTWKNILYEACQYSDFTSDKFKDIQKRIELSIAHVNPAEEYREFTEKHKTSPANPIVFQFDETLIEDTLGKLQPNTLTVDNLTVDWLRSRLSDLENSVKETQEKQIKLAAESGTQTPTMQSNNGINGIGKDANKYSKDINALRCQEKQTLKLVDMIKTALNDLGCEELPSGCDDISVEQNFIDSTSVDQPETATSSSFILQKGAEVMNLLSSHFRRKSQPVQNRSSITTTPERTPRSARASLTTRSLSSLASSSVNSLPMRDPLTDDFVNITDNIYVDVDTNNIVKLTVQQLHTANTDDQTTIQNSLCENIEIDDCEAFPEEKMSLGKFSFARELKMAESLELEDDLDDKKNMKYQNDAFRHDDKVKKLEEEPTASGSAQKRVLNDVLDDLLRDFDKNITIRGIKNKSAKKKSKENYEDQCDVKRGKLTSLFATFRNDLKTQSGELMSDEKIPSENANVKSALDEDSITITSSSDQSLIIKDKNKSVKTEDYLEPLQLTGEKRSTVQRRKYAKAQKTTKSKVKFRYNTIKSKFKFNLSKGGRKSSAICAHCLKKIPQKSSELSHQTELLCNCDASLNDNFQNINHFYTEIDCMTLATNRPLYEEEWFHGVLPREEVVRLLKNEGDFLVRETIRNEESQIVLSVCWNGHKHFIVQTTTEGYFRFEGRSFPSIQELIMYQYTSEATVTQRSGAILRKPVLRERWELSNDDVILLDKIGRGNFGDVYKAKLKPSKKDVAVKTCRMTLPEEQKRKFLQEGRILKQYDHPNIVKLIGICVQKQPIMIVMELVPGGSLLNYLRKQKSTFTTKQLIHMCRDAAAGMRYLESKNCIHRDLAARNCLIGYENIVKISDFGMSREEEEYIVSDGMKQIPIKWTAPEALNFGKYTSLCDVWSYGILMWEIFSKGDTPYSGMSNARARERIDAGYRMPAPEQTPPEMYRLMLRCWSYEAEARPHFDEIFSIVENSS
ncbi:Tyrosine-protein kinase [Sergentomyia squamirostris]